MCERGRIAGEKRDKGLLDDVSDGGIHFQEIHERRCWLEECDYLSELVPVVMGIGASLLLG